MKDLFSSVIIEDGAAAIFLSGLACSDEVLSDSISFLRVRFSNVELHSVTMITDTDGLKDFFSILPNLRAKNAKMTVKIVFNCLLLCLKTENISETSEILSFMYNLNIEPAAFFAEERNVSFLFLPDAAEKLMEAILSI